MKHTKIRVCLLVSWADAQLVRQVLAWLRGKIDGGSDEQRHSSLLFIASVVWDVNLAAAIGCIFDAAPI